MLLKAKLIPMLTRKNLRKGEKNQRRFIIRKFKGFESSLAAGDNFFHIRSLNFIEVTYELIRLAQELIKKIV